MFIGQADQARLTVTETKPHDVKSPIGTYMVDRTATYSYEAGPTFIEVWSPARGCWARRDLVLKERVRTILDLDLLAANGPCASDAAAHTPPVTPRPKKR